jgi:hypothetical protein
MSAGTPGERTQIAKIAAHTRWAKTEDRGATARAGQAGLLARFEREVDPDNRLAPEERARRAESARRAHFQRLARKSAQARRGGAA